MVYDIASPTLLVRLLVHIISGGSGTWSRFKNGKIKPMGPGRPPESYSKPNRYGFCHLRHVLEKGRVMHHHKVARNAAKSPTKGQAPAGKSPRAMKNTNAANAAGYSLIWL